MHKRHLVKRPPLRPHDKQNRDRRLTMRTTMSHVLPTAVAMAVGLVMFPAAASADPIVVGQDFGVVPGAQPQAATTTIPTWRDTFTDPTDGVTYSVDIVGNEDPRTPGAGTTTIPTEIIPVDLSFDANGGQSFNGSDVTQAVVNSPIFQPADYSAFSNNTGVQYEDAVMRSQFNQVGASPFHLVLQPTVLPALEIHVPADKGQVETYPSGAQYGCVDYLLLFHRMWSYIGSMHISPTTLPIFIMKWMRGGLIKDGICQAGYVGVHGAGNPGRSFGATNSETTGQTWIEASYEPAPISPITANHPNAFNNIDTLAHEISEWADDPYALNFVQPYNQPTSGYAPCDPLLETGDPVNQYTVSLPGNTYFQNLPGNDGTWSVQDEVFLPWFARETPNMTSEPEAGSDSGRYTFFGDLNPNPLFHQPATACS
jgi:hypothetical protein